MPDGTPRTRDGVEMTARDKYWLIPCLQERDFSGLHKGQIPNKVLFCASREEIERWQPQSLSRGGLSYASTKELANQYAVEDYIVNTIEFRESELQRELELTRKKKAKIRDRLNLYLKQQNKESHNV